MFWKRSPLELLIIICTAWFLKVLFIFIYVITLFVRSYLKRGLYLFEQVNSFSLFGTSKEFVLLIRLHWLVWVNRGLSCYSNSPLILLYSPLYSLVDWKEVSKTNFVSEWLRFSMIIDCISWQRKIWQKIIGLREVKCELLI